MARKYLTKNVFFQSSDLIAGDDEGVAALHAWTQPLFAVVIVVVVVVVVLVDECQELIAVDQRDRECEE